MSTEENKAIMRRMIEEVWNKGNLEVADELFAPNHTSPSAPQLPPGSEGVKMIAAMFRKAMPDYHMTIDLIVSEGDRVAAHFTQTGTQTGDKFLGIPPAGKKATWGESGILRIEGGRIVESWYEADMQSLMQQLSAIP